MGNCTGTLRSMCSRDGFSIWGLWGLQKIPGRVLQTNVTIFPSQCLRSRSVSSPPLSSHKKPVSSLNNYRPVAPHEVSRQLTQSKHCTRTHYSLCTGLTDNAISFTLHKIPTHLENKDSYVRLLFIDCNSRAKDVFDCDSVLVKKYAEVLVQMYADVFNRLSARFKTNKSALLDKQCALVEVEKESFLRPTGLMKIYKRRHERRTFRSV